MEEELERLSFYLIWLTATRLDSHPFRVFVIDADVTQ